MIALRGRCIALTALLLLAGQAHAKACRGLQQSGDCNIQADHDFGDATDQFPQLDGILTPEDCCKACGAQPAGAAGPCVGWAHMGTSCWLKPASGATGGLHPKAGVTAGTAPTGAPPPPSMAPVPPSSGYTLKKGFPWTDSDPEFDTKATRVNAAWAYDWNFRRPPPLKTSTPFIPMIWGSGMAQDAGLMASLATLDQPGIENTLLGFNEPDWQSYVSVDEAISLWPLLEKTGRRLGSPAMALDANAPGSWLEQFMQKARAQGLRVDFLCMHWYGAPTDATQFLDSLEELHSTWGLPIWVTEFAPADWGASAAHPTSFNAAQALEFAQAVLPELIQRSYIERFAWMTAVSSDPNIGFSALFQDDWTLTPLGAYYASL